MKEKITIYQVLPRLYGNTKGKNTPNGSIEENGCGKMNFFDEKELRRIKAFGFTHIWYTGLLEHATQTCYSRYGIAPDHPAVVKGKAGSPYAVKDYYDIDPDLAENVEARREEFEALLERTHKAGLKMVMDFVPNHVARQYHSDSKPKGAEDLGANDNPNAAFSPDNNFYYITGHTLHTDFDTRHAAPAPYKEYPAKATGNDCFSDRPSATDWYETAKLNYGIDYCNGRQSHFSPVPDTWKKMTDILLFWAEKGVDAFRCDMAEMVPCEFWAWAIPQVKAKHGNVVFIAEVYNPAEYRDYIRRGGFDYLYDKVGLYDTLRAVVRREASAACITGCWQSVDDIRTHMLNFLENHDEQRIASPFFAGDARKARPAFVVSACLGENPVMLYAGQELGERGMDAEGFSGCDGRTTIFDYWRVSSLEKLAKGPSAWTKEEKELCAFYERTLRLCNQEAAIREGACYDLMYANYDGTCNFNCDRTFAFIRKSGREMLLIVCNFDSCNIHIGVRIPQHAFDFLNLRKGEYAAIDLLSGETQTVSLKAGHHTFVDVPADGAVILKIKY